MYNEWDGININYVQKKKAKIAIDWDITWKQNEEKFHKVSSH